MAEMVQQQGMNHIFPNTIPKKRGNKDVLTERFMCCFFIAVGCFIVRSHKITFLVCSLSWTFLLLIFIQICKRSCQYFEEHTHLESRYEGKILHLLRDIFSFSSNDAIYIAVGITVAIGIAAIDIMFGNPLEFIQNEPISWICVLIGMQFFNSFINLEESPLSTAKSMDRLKSLDYGSGMAFSFFYGYLNLILPCTGDERKGLKEQIEDYESKHNVKFGSKKLYIFIPLSAFCPTSIDEYSNCMTTSESLQWRRMDRAGVKSRQYHNSVYKVQANKKELPIYVCAEYATPLLTLYEIMSKSTAESKRYKKYQKEIVTNFYLTLDNILKTDRSCTGLAELIYYRDIDNDGNPLNPEQLDVGLLLLERINKK